MSVVPATARSFRVRDPELTTTLSYAGAQLVDEHPDVEIGTIDDLTGDAACAVVEVRSPELGDARRLVRGGKRVVRSSGVRLAVARARRHLRRLGYASTSAVAWERGVRLDYGNRKAHGVLAHRLPLSVVVAGYRSGKPETQLDAAVAAAGWEAARALDVTSVLLSPSGVIVATSEREVLRVAIGTPAARIQEQRAALERLRTAGPPASVSERVPWPLGGGTEGLAAWSLEERLRGEVAPLDLSDALQSECLRFLVDLHDIASDEKRPAAAAADAAVVVRHMRADAAEAITALAADVDGATADLPQGFSHGDFWSGNLLVQDDRIAGVVDWPSADPCSPPLVDLLHLQASARRELTGEYLGAIIVQHLLPAARSGGGSMERAYCRLRGLALGPHELQALVLAYWLRALRRYLVDPDQEPAHVDAPAWRRGNVDTVLRALEGRRRPSGHGTAAGSQ